MQEAVSITSISRPRSLHHNRKKRIENYSGIGDKATNTCEDISLERLIVLIYRWKYGSRKRIVVSRGHIGINQFANLFFRNESNLIVNG